MRGRVMEHSDALRCQQEPHGHGGLPAHLLVVERQEELAAEARDARQHVSDERRRDRALAEESQVEERGRRAAPGVREERGDQRGGDAEGQQHRGRRPRIGAVPQVRDAVDEERHPRRQERETGDVEP